MSLAQCDQRLRLDRVSWHEAEFPYLGHYGQDHEHFQQLQVPANALPRPNAAGPVLTPAPPRSSRGRHADVAAAADYILLAMTLAEAIETTRIHSLADLTGDRTALVTTRPFRAPHHTISDAGLIGGGHVPMPGEVSRANHGILF